MFVFLNCLVKEFTIVPAFLYMQFKSCSDIQPVELRKFIHT